MSKKGFNSIHLILLFSIFFSTSLFAACPEPASHFCNVCVRGTLVSNTGIFNNLFVSGASVFSGPLDITDSTQSTGCTNGALTVAGGVGIVGDLNVCGSISGVSNIMSLK